MGTVIIRNTIHERVKRLALDASTTLVDVVHDGCEHLLDNAEKYIARKKKEKTAKAKASAKVQ